MEDPTDPPNDNRQSGKSQNTLKRGDACLACRKRRIRCDAEKPACSTCVRLKKECQYVVGKPISKMARLKERIATLEERIASREVPDAPGPSVYPVPMPSGDMSLNPGPSTQASAGSSGLNTPRLSSFDGSTIDPTLFSSFTATGPLPDFSNPMTGDVMTYDQMMTQNAGSSPHRFAQSTNPHPLQQPDPNFDFDFGLLDSTMMDLAGSFLPTDLNSGHSDLFDTSVPAAINSGGFRSPGASGPTDQGGSLFNGPQVILKSDSGWSRQSEPQPSLNFGNGTLSGGWFDPTDLPPPVRDHLLDMFFSQGSIFISMFDIPRFYASLTLPPAKRPHPALLYSMYLLAARRSSHAKLKALESKFCEITEQQINIGNRQNDRTLDIIQAVILFAQYQITIEQFSVAFTVAAMAVRLSMTCGLHRIPSGVFHPPRTVNSAVSFMLRTGGWYLEPPNDGTELGIRIHTFWAVFQAEYSIAIAHVWEPILRPESITTPLPRPLEEYALHLVTAKDDVTLMAALRAPSPSRPIVPGHDSWYICAIKSWGFMEKVFRLRDSPPELPIVPPPSVDLITPGRIASGAASIQASCPKAFTELKAAMDYFCDTLPLQFSLPWHRWEGNEPFHQPQQPLPDLVSKIWFLIGFTYLHLFNVRTLAERNDDAVRVARRLVKLVLGSLSICETWRGYDMFFIIIWNDLAMTLLRELKRIEFAGNAKETDDAHGIEADFDLVMGAIKEWSLLNVKTKHGDADIAAINWRMLDTFKPMPKEMWLEAAQEAMERFR
ncbi:hypothetical protein BD324DRAFT_635980 [Kockovaella imperatae]|uniref:Zn(2)-C6 fungal-type domain-containing protein n=1 Tax=Kockovaella imperatae TaxID=4999 RepID=A0A1Y1U8T3_9TREE|nr:hypothetical protein BD324DRAFT_635980 [Kockovaella imperatae]ORX34450.1 hypothetical protein BD324DRAFT_635980 [Kockovaella imperatae]